MHRGQIPRPRESLTAGPGLMNGQTPLFLTLLGAALLLVGVAVLQPYSVTSPWAVYSTPAQRFLQAAVRGDSLALARQSGSAEPVVWALAAARRYPDSLAAWARDAEAWSGGRWGDTAEVVLQISGQVCSEHPIWIRFVGSGDNARVLRVSSTCFEPK
jgi:hypothetical protein